jgi:hypothetical protein
MPEFQRRDFLKGTAAFADGVTAALTASRRADAGDPSFMNNVSDPVVSGKELPSFKFVPAFNRAMIHRFSRSPAVSHQSGPGRSAGGPGRRVLVAAGGGTRTRSRARHLAVQRPGAGGGATRSGIEAH